MKKLRRRLVKTFERQKKLFEFAVDSLTDENRVDFLDTIYGLPGLTAYVDQKIIDEYDETNGESPGDFLERHFAIYKADYEKRNKGKRAKECS